MNTPRLTYNRRHLEQAEHCVGLILQDTQFSHGQQDLSHVQGKHVTLFI